MDRDANPFQCWYKQCWVECVQAREASNWIDWII